MISITSLAKSKIKYNKSRTLLTAIAIMFTTMLLMGLGTSAVGLFDMNKQQAAAEGNVHAIFKDLTEEQINILKNHVDVDAVEASEIFATIEYGKMNGSLTHTNDIKSGIYRGVGNLIEGHYAENTNEICGPKAFFERLGADPVIGNKVSISFRPNGKGKIETREFVISGIVSEIDISKINVSDNRIAYSASISESLINEYILPENRLYLTSIRINGEENLNYDVIMEKIEDVAEDIGYDKESISFNKEYLYAMTETGVEMASIVFAIALIITIFSGLVIYSIYYVGIITDVQEIGKLKALGASKKQIKRMLQTEGMLVSSVAIPIGLALGFAIPYFALPIVIRKISESIITVSPIENLHMFSLPVLLTVAVVAIITVYISMLKPMRMAAKISPVEAIRYQESNHSKKLRNGNKSVNVFRLCIANLTRNKRRTVVTILTMGLSCVLFMSLAGMLNSVRAEDIARRAIEEGEFRIKLDYSTNDEEYPENNLDSLQQENIFNDEFITNIKNIDGIENIKRSKKVLISSTYQSGLFNEDRRITLSYFTEEDAKKYQKIVERGNIDYEKLVAENGAIFTSNYFFEEYGLTIGDTIPLVVYDGNKKIPLEIKLSASIDDGGNAYFLIPQQIFDNLGLEFDCTTDLYIYADKDKYNTVKTELQAIEQSNEHFIMYSLDEEMILGEMSTNLVKYSMYVILIMIAVIGFINLINTMVASIITRKHELGVLQAIGLSDRQLTKMLAGEGFVIIAGTLIASVTLGNIFGYLMFLWGKKSHILSLTIYHFPLFETIGLALMLILGQLAITYFIRMHVRKESIIERISL